MENADRCQLLSGETGLEAMLKKKKELFVLFYASWCPFSLAFLPKFIASAGNNEACHVRIMIDDEDGLVDKYNIEVYPTVLFFKDGKVAKRLDGVSHVGLDEGKLGKFIRSCA